MSTQKLKCYRRWAARLKTKIKKYNTGTVTMSQVMATVDQEPNQIQAVPCEGISVRQVEFGFGIKSAPLGERPWMNPTQLISLPESFFHRRKYLNEMTRSTLHPSENEAQARVLITHLLESIYTELRIAQFAGPEDIGMLLETSLSFFPMNYLQDDRKIRKVLCRGQSDYSFYFQNTEVQAINLVIIEAKRYGITGSGDGQILAYMSMVWLERRKRRQSDCSVYGCLTDGSEFRFFEISHDGEWSSKPILLRHYADTERGMNVIANHIANFLKHGLDTSPLHSSVPSRRSGSSSLSTAQLLPPAVGLTPLDTLMENVT